MAEGRFVSKAIAIDVELNTVVSLEADYLFGRCIPHLDVEGRMKGHPAEVKAMVCPLRAEMTVESVAGALRELSRADLVEWYEVDGRQFLHFPGFGSHNKVRRDREAVSKVPPPPKTLGENKVPDYSGSTPGVRPAEVEVEVEVEVEELPLRIACAWEDKTGDERLREWLGPMRAIVDRLPNLAAKGIGGAYCTPLGTAEYVWTGTPDADRPTILADACERWLSEDHAEFHAKLFLRILQDCIRERTAPLRATGTDTRRPTPLRQIPANQGALD